MSVWSEHGLPLQEHEPSNPLWQKVRAPTEPSCSRSCENTRQLGAQDLFRVRQCLQQKCAWYTKRRATSAMNATKKKYGEKPQDEVMTPYRLTSSFEEDEDVAWRLQARIALLVRCQAMRCLALWISHGRYDDAGEQSSTPSAFPRSKHYCSGSSRSMQLAAAQNGQSLSQPRTGETKSSHFQY